ncbi:hypothetical protein VTK56DRAFT_275 [Thermocarpiscus australiensis]
MLHSRPQPVLPHSRSRDSERGPTGARPAEYPDPTYRYPTDGEADIIPIIQRLLARFDRSTAIIPWAYLSDHDVPSNAF